VRVFPAFASAAVVVAVVVVVVVVVVAVVVGGGIVVVVVDYAVCYCMKALHLFPTANGLSWILALTRLSFLCIDRDTRIWKNTHADTHTHTHTHTHTNTHTYTSHTHTHPLVSQKRWMARVTSIW
jgi:hypothetical protein